MGGRSLTIPLEMKSFFWGGDLKKHLLSQFLKVRKQLSLMVMTWDLMKLAIEMSAGATFI